MGVTGGRGGGRDSGCRQQRVGGAGAQPAEVRQAGARAGVSPFPTDSPHALP